MERSEQIGKLIAALAKAQTEFTPALKSSDNPFFNSKYADLATNIEAVRPALNKHGIAFLQFDTSDIGRQVGIVTTALHHGEQFISVTAEAPAVGTKGFNVQSLGACWTYLRRYTLQAICGLASEDDDGNSLTDDPKKAAVFAEVEKQKAQRKPVSEAVVIPPELDFEYVPASGLLICRITAVAKKATKEGKEYLIITVNKPINGQSKLYYWHSTHREAMLYSVEKIVKMMVTEKPKGITVDLVLEIDGIKTLEPPTDETQARLLASTMDFEEEDLRELHSRCKGSWSTVLEKLKEEKERRDNLPAA